MQVSTCFIHFLFPLVCILHAANGFIALTPCQSCENNKKSGRLLFQKQTTIEKAVLLMEQSSNDKVETTDKDIVSEEDMTETQKLMSQVKEAGLAGVISYALWELGFWTISVPVCIFGYYEVTGHWPDLSSSEDQGKLGAEAFAFVNFARFAVPLRIGLALSTTPWIDENIVRRFLKKDEQK